MPRRSRRSVLPLALAAMLLAACHEEPSAPAVSLEATPLAPPAGAAPGRKSPKVELPPEVAEALRGIEWEPLDFLEYLPELAYKVTPGCVLEYVDLGELSASDEVFGSVKRSFYQSFSLVPAPGAGWLRKPSPRLEYLQLQGGGRRLDAFVDLRGESLAPLKLGVFRDSVAFPSRRSPVFPATDGAQLAQVSAVNAWPRLPALGEPAEWSYNLLFDSSEALARRPPAKVEFVGWLRLGFQRAAYLTATWAEDHEPLAISPALAHLKIGRRGPLSSSAQQRQEVRGHYLISEHGHLVLAHVEGLARVRNTYLLTPDRRHDRRRAEPVEKEVLEDRVFSFTTKLVSDCNGSLFSKVESTELPQEEVVELAEQFFSLISIDRKAEAAALLSPAIRYGFPDGGVPWLLLREHTRAVGDGFLGKPTASQGEQGGVDFVGANKKTRRPIYSTIRGARVGEQRFLTFVGSSSSPSRAKWDLLRVEPGNIYSGAVTLYRQKW